MLSKLKKILFFTLLITLIIAFFTRNNYRNVDEVDSKVLKDPIQTELENEDIIKFTKDDYEYELTPLYNYEINGFVVHKMDYTLFSIYKSDSVFPTDLCMIWGENVKNKIYQNKDVEFSQDMRFCFAKWSGNISFNLENLSNNHLLVNNKEIEKKMNTIYAGDQVKIKGKLVNTKARNLGKPGKYDPDYFEWNTSTTRLDTGAGACETIYVEDIEILKKSNIVSYYLYKISLYGLALYIVLSILWFFVDTFIPNE